MNYKNLASDILKLVGGSDNVSHLEHCSTRLRFTLVDEKKADAEALKKLKGVMGVVRTAQFQVIIGNDVIEVYDELLKIGSFNGTSKSQKNSSKEKTKIGPAIFDFIVGVFQPLVPVIAGAGILKSLLMLFIMFGWMEKGSQAYNILYYIGDAAFYFLPLMVAVTTATKLKANKLVALGAVGVLLLPSMTAMIGEGTTIFGMTVKNISYASQVFPAILSVSFLALVEKLFTKISPKPIRVFFVPLMSLVIAVPTTLLFLGPLGFNIGQGFTAVILFMFNTFGWIAVALLATVLPFMIATGMHKALVPYAVSSITEMGKELLYLPASLAHNISESGACFAVAVRTKDNDLRSTAFSAGISALFGITEPALYGVTIQNKRALAGVMSGSLIGGAFIGIVGLEAFAAVGPGIASISMFISETSTSNIIYALIGFGISFAVAFAATLVLWKDTEENVESTAKEALETKGTLVSPLKGKSISITEVKDDVFAERLVGDGLAIIPEEGKLYAPCDGTIEMVFDTKHALAMKTAMGAELLFHIGLDTVRLEGKHFTPKVKVGDRVKTGDLLMEFDKEAIKKAGYDTVTPILVTNPDNFELKVMEPAKVQVGSPIINLTAMGVN